MLREEFGIDCCVKQDVDVSNKEMFVTLTDDARQQCESELFKLIVDSNNRSLPKINKGELGSRNNPSGNGCLSTGHKELTVLF